MAEGTGFLGRILKLIAGFIIFLFLLAIALAGYWYMGPYRGFTEETFVEVEHGMSSRAIAQLLASHGVVRSPWAFLAARALHPRATLQAGEYRFGSERTPLQVFDTIRKGEVFFEELTFPEGSNLFDIAGILKNSDTVKSDDFLKAAADPANIRDLDPLAPNLEGFLFPSTYRVTHRTTASQLCRAMTAEFRKQWAAAAGNAGGSRSSPRPHPRLVSGKRNGRAGGTTAGRCCIYQSAAHGYSATVRSYDGLCGTHRKPLPRRDSPLRSRERQSL